jgi:TRAP-type C4-dicarboxylate transport system substrate-binding protein
MIGRLMRRILDVGATVGVALGLVLPMSTLAPTAATAAETFAWKGVTNHRKGAAYKKWLWLQEELPKRTNGRIHLQVFTFEELGLTGTETLRTMKTGLIDIAEVQTGYVASDFPLIEAIGLPGVPADYEMARKLYDAWLKNVIRPREDIMGGKVLAHFSWNSTYLWTKFPLNSLDDLKGKKIRVFSPAMAAYLKGLGAEPLSMPIAEVYGALQRGLMDGLCTGPDQVKAMSMWEVAVQGSDIGLAPSGSFITIGKKSWDSLPPDLQKIVLDMGPELTDLGWKEGEENNQEGIKLGKEHGMKFVIPSKTAWRPILTKIAKDQVIPWWIGRTGPEGKEDFNKYLAPIVGFKIE